MRSKLVVTAAALLAVTACNTSTSAGNGGPACPATAPLVCMHNTAFEPVTKTVTVGTTVTWKNLDPVNHTTTSDPSNPGGCPTWNQPVNAGETSPGVTFGTALVTCNYHCSIHSTMQAQIRVK